MLLPALIKGQRYPQHIGPSERTTGATPVIIGHSTKFRVGSAGEGASWQMISF